ncbi:MAG: DUF1365 domain-containing protein, partial [Pseudomonadales bacterium]|nr:DUF1365 domain-containing protein [Pseudomonadales bacterium]
DEICGTSAFVSRERNNLLGFFRQDFLPGKGSLHQRVVNEIHRATGADFHGDVFLLATWRQFGYVMNPLTLFFCYSDGELQHIVAEVTNTPWNERHCYVLPAYASRREGDAITWTIDKSFHVSPFMPMNTRYQWRLHEPADQLNIRLNVLEDDKLSFYAGLHLEAEEITARSIRHALLRHGWLSVSTTARIYLQAAKLWHKRATFYPHPNTANANDAQLQGEIRED